MICDNIAVNEKGHLTFAGFDTVELARKGKTRIFETMPDETAQIAVALTIGEQSHISQHLLEEHQCSIFC